MKQRKPNKKNLIWFSVLMVAAIAVVAIGILSFGNQKGYRTITVFETEGNVSVINNGIEYEAYPGMVLQEGYAVVTSANSYVRMVLDGDKYVKLEQGSRATFETLGLLGSGKTRINLERGTLISEIVNPLDADDEFVVNTTNAILAVRGTIFRVDVQGLFNGEVRTDVYTYGGKVASRRILPDGELVEEEVLIDAGYKAAISMTEEDTIYLTENVTEGANQERSITPIAVGSISDNDMVDMFFASDNGHELFITTSEIKAIIEDRGLPLEEYSAPYDKAEEVVSESIAATTPDDNRPLVQEETETEEEAEQVAGVPSDGGKEPEGDTPTEEPVDVAVEETPEELPEEIVDEPIPEEEEESESSPVVEDVTSEAEPEPEPAPEETPETGAGEDSTPEDSGGSDTTVTPPASGGTTCSHTGVTSIVDATCTVAGKTTVTCSKCGTLLSETEIPATGHTLTFVGTADIHGTCDVCNETITQHDYLDVTIDATCAAEGETEYTCNCGYSYTETLPMLAHTEATEYIDGTETADGLRRVYCSVCNNTIEEETLLSIPKNFPDDVFAAYVTTNFDTDGYASLNTEELANLQAARTVNLAGTSSTDGGVASLAGIEYFTALYTLDCSYNTSLTAIDISQCSELTNLDVRETSLTALDTSGNAKLLNMYCSGTNIAALDVSQNKKLDYLWCDNTNLRALDVSQNTSLDSLNCANTAIADLDLTSNTYISSLDVTNCTALTSLNLNGVSWFNGRLDLTRCSGLQELGLESTGITELDVSGNTALRSLNVNGTDISALDTSNNTELEVLQCSGCYSLTTLDLSNNTKLQEVDVSGTYVTAVNFGTNAELTTVKAKETRINTLDLSACNNVTMVEVSGEIGAINVNDATGLTALDVSGCNFLSELQFQNTGITTIDLSSMGSLSIVNGSGSGVRDITISSTSPQTVDFSDCTSLVSLSADAGTTLDVSGCAALTTLETGGSFTALDLSTCTNLTTLKLNGCNSLTALDLSHNTNLETLSLTGYYNQLQSLNVIGTKLTTLNVSSTNLENVNVSGMTTLTELYPNQSCLIINASGCTNLTRIDNLSNMGNMKELYLDNTQIDSIYFSYASLQKLVLSNNTAVTKVELYDLSSLNELVINGCTSLDTLQLINIPTTMIIDATTCTSLEDYNVNTSGSDNITINFQ